MRIKERIIWICCIALLLSVIFIFVFREYFPVLKAGENEYNQLMEIFDEVYDKINDRYVDVDKLDSKNLIYGAITGMVESLEDPYSMFLKPDLYKDFTEDIQGEFAGIGAYINKEDDRITIVAPIAGTPADNAGIISGDVITKIDGVSTKGMSSSEAANLIKGKPGTDVVLTILRTGKTEEMEITIERNIIEIPVVKNKMISDDTGYLNLVTFSRTAPKLVKEAIIEMKSSGMKKLIFDVRNNYGGTLDSGKAIVDLFLEDGLIVYTVGRNGEILKKLYAEKQHDDILDIPVVLLINGNSASATEILAGALKDTNRAKLIGSTTYGKGSVQSFFRLANEIDDEAVGMKVTIAHWYTPAGNMIDKNGIDPHIDMSIPDEELLDRAYYENKLYESGEIETFLEEYPDFTRSNVENFKEELEQKHIYIETDRLGQILTARKNRRKKGFFVDTEYDKVLKKAVEVLKDYKYEQNKVISYN